MTEETELSEKMQDLTIIKEGKAQVGFTGETFYNEIQEFNRDLTVTVLREFVKGRLDERKHKTNTDDEPPAKKKFKIEEADGSIRILDALSATGLRAFRFALEVPHVASVLANDFSENAVEAIKRNIVLNGLEDKVTANFGDAIMTMMHHRALDKRFHAVDLDPYGSASQFLDSAVQCVADRGTGAASPKVPGILMVTCTDMAVLCGNLPESCNNKYDAIPLRMKSCHEFALRILLRSIESHATRFARYIEPLLSVSVDYYIRVFVRVHTGANKAHEAAAKTGRVLACSGCHSFEIIPIIKRVVNGNSVKSGPPIFHSNLLGTDQKCKHCGNSVHEGGPIYTGQIHSPEFVKSLVESLAATPEDERLGTYDRMLGMLSVVAEELPDVPLYHGIDQLIHVIKCAVPKTVNIRSALLNAGYRVSGSHANPRALKTNAPLDFIWDIFRTTAKNANVSVEKMKDELPGKAILQKAIINTCNFGLHAEAESHAKKEGLLRYQFNKGKNWGPRAKAVGSVNSVKAGAQIDPKLQAELNE